MIDDPATVSTLMDAMEASLPIPASPSGALVRLLREQGLRISRERVLFIQGIFYGGDAGGITCDVTPAGGESEPVAVSLTHLRIDPSHPLYRDIRAYQRRRVQRIAEAEQ